MQGYWDVYKWTILKRTSPEVKCLHPMSSRREMCTSSVSNVIYLKFSHGAAFYTLNGKNINVMLEFFNPIALRMAKTLWSFGSSKCNRVKLVYDLAAVLLPNYFQPAHKVSSHCHSVPSGIRSMSLWGCSTNDNHIFSMVNPKKSCK